MSFGDKHFGERLCVITTPAESMWLMLQMNEHKQRSLHDERPFFLFQLHGRTSNDELMLHKVRDKYPGMFNQ